MKKIKTLNEENKCSCFVCKIKEQKRELYQTLNEVERYLQDVSGSLYSQDHFMDHDGF